MAKKKHKPLKVMVASTVYHNKTLIHQVCAALEVYGYHVINSEYGTLYPTLGFGNTDACKLAVNECDLFFGIINPWYSSGITHEEFKEAIRLDRPRRFMAHSTVPFSRKLLKQFMYDATNSRTTFIIKKTSVMDDIRVIDMYNEAIQDNLPIADRKFHWVQEYHHELEVLKHVETLFSDYKRVETDLINLNGVV